MNAKKKPKVLTKKNLEEAVDNLADISDLSGSDSEDDTCYANSVNSIPDTYLNQPDDDVIEQRLEEIFGVGDDYNDVNIQDTLYRLQNHYCQF